MEKIMVQGRCFIDDFGRERIFNGVNLVHKNDDDPDTGRKPVRSYIPTWAPYEIETLARRGVNIVRLGLIWAAVEPQPGVYDDNYLRKIREYADLCARNGIYIYLDMHQDLYSDLYGDGAPGWATLAEGAEFEEKIFVWAEGYFTGEAVHKAYDNFWANAKAPDGIGLMDHFTAMWQPIARICLDLICSTSRFRGLQAERYSGRSSIKCARCWAKKWAKPFRFWTLPGRWGIRRN